MKKKASAKKNVRPPLKEGQKQIAKMKTSPKKKSNAKKKPLASRKEHSLGAEGARAILKRFMEKKKVKALFSFETRKELKEKKVVELRAIAREAGIKLKALRKSEMVEEIAKWIGPFTKAGKKPSGKAGKTLSARKKRTAPSKGKVVSPARPLLKEKPAGRVKGHKAEEVLPETAGDLLLEREKPVSLVKKAFGPMLAGKEDKDKGISEFMDQREHDLKGPAGKEALAKAGDVDRINAVAVDPRTVFINWDITEATARKGRPFMRVYDVTGVEFDGENQLGFRDLRLSGRSGESFIEALPGKEYIVDAGVMEAGGRFMPARRSSKVITPPDAPPEGTSLLPDYYFEFTTEDYGHG
jgi:hypothetical protein